MSEELELYLTMTDEETRTISMTGIEFSDALFRFAIEPFLKMDRDGEPITIYLSTPGGCLYPALCFADVIERAQSPVMIYMLGEVASAGMYIPMGAFNNENVEVVAYPSTVGMLHHGSWFLDTMEMERAEDWFKFARGRKNEYMRDYVLSHSNYTADDIARLDRADRWMDAEELVTFGFANRIL